MVLVNVRPLRGCRLCSYIHISFLCMFMSFIIKLKKLLNCDWLRAGLHFSGNLTSALWRNILSLIINENRMKTRTIKDLHYSWNLKVLSICSRLKACAILREFSNATRSLNPNCTRIHTITSGYQYHFLSCGIPWRKLLVKALLFLTSNSPFLRKRNLFVLKACPDMSF